MGGSVAQHNNFWQLFVRPAGTTRWKLVTPPGVADNGGLVLADGGQSLVTGFRPSQYLTYSPLIATRDGGRPGHPQPARRRASPTSPTPWPPRPAAGNLLALLTGGTVELAAPGCATWTTLASQRSWPPPRPAGAAAWPASPPPPSPPRGAPARRACTRPGTAGIFTCPERDLAGGRTRAARRPRPPAHHRAAADPHRARQRGAAGRRHRARRQPPRRLVRRRRRPLDTVAAAHRRRRRH